MNEGNMCAEWQGEREYFKCIPTALSESEYYWEMEERKKRKKSLMIRGIRTTEKGLKEEVKGVIKRYMNIEVYIARINAVGGGLVVELDSLENKIDILKRRGMLKGIKLWIDDDFTMREIEVQNWLELVAEEEKGNGFETKVGYAKIKVNENWYGWKERSGGGVEQINFRGQGKGMDSK